MLKYLRSLRVYVSVLNNNNIMRVGTRTRTYSYTKANKALLVPNNERLAYCISKRREKTPTTYFGTGSYEYEYNKL